MTTVPLTIAFLMAICHSSYGIVAGPWFLWLTVYVLLGTPPSNADLGAASANRSSASAQNATSNTSVDVADVFSSFDPCWDLNDDAGSWDHVHQCAPDHLMTGAFSMESDFLFDYRALSPPERASLKSELAQVPTIPLASVLLVVAHLPRLSVAYTTVVIHAHGIDMATSHGAWSARFARAHGGLFGGSAASERADEGEGGGASAGGASAGGEGGGAAGAWQGGATQLVPQQVETPASLVHSSNMVLALIDAALLVHTHIHPLPTRADLGADMRLAVGAMLWYNRYGKYVLVTGLIWLTFAPDPLSNATLPRLLQREEALCPSTVGGALGWWLAPYVMLAFDYQALMASYYEDVLQPLGHERERIAAHWAWLTVLTYLLPAIILACRAAGELHALKQARMHICTRVHTRAHVYAHVCTSMHMGAHGCACVRTCSMRTCSMHTCSMHVASSIPSSGSHLTSPHLTSPRLTSPHLTSELLVEFERKRSFGKYMHRRRGIGSGTKRPRLIGWLRNGIGS